MAAEAPDRSRVEFRPTFVHNPFKGVYNECEIIPARNWVQHWLYGGVDMVHIYEWDSEAREFRFAWTHADALLPGNDLDKMGEQS